MASAKKDNIRKYQRSILRWSFLFIFFSFQLSPLTSQAQVRIPTGATGNSRGGITGGQVFSGQNQQQGSRIGNDSISHSDTSATKGLIFHEEIPDSVLRNKVFFFHHTPHQVKIDQLWNPTLDPTGVQFSDPLDGLNGDYYLGKGTIGHPHESIFPVYGDGLSLLLQDDEMGGYAKTPENIRFYQTQTPYSLLSYNSSLKKDYLVHIAHTQNVIPGWNLSFDYQLMCPEGVLSSSGAKDHFLDFTTNYFSPDSRLQIQAGFIWQSFSIDENGGLSNDDIFTSNQMSNFSGLPVKLSGAGSSYLRHDVFGRITYNLVRQVERIRERDSLTVRFDTVSGDSVLQVLDTLVVTDTLRVGSPTVLNPGVFGAEMRYHRQKRAAYLPAFSDSTLWSQASASLFWTNDAYPDYRWHNPLKITLGITPRRFDATLRRTTLSAPDTIVSTAALNPFATLEIGNPRLSFRLEGELDNTLLNLGAKEPDYRTAGTLSLMFDSARNSGLELSLVLQQQNPTVAMLHASNYLLDPVSTHRFGLHLFYSSDSSFLRLLDLDVHSTWMSHNVWYDSLLTVHTGNQDLWLSQAALTLRLAWGWFHVDMQHLLQHSTDKLQVDVPLWSCKNSLYGDFSLFKGALRLQFGTDIRYFTSFIPDGYDPATGLFFFQDNEVGDYLWADVFLNLQVKRASIYLKAGHLNALWENSPRYFLLPHYPGQKFGLFWGLTWHFFD